MASLKPIELYDQQYDFVYSNVPNVCMGAGIGSGKTIAGCYRALLAAYGEIGDQKIRTPNLGMITAPTYVMLRDATLRTFMELAEPFIKDFVKSEMKAVMHNGSEILFRSTSDPEKLRGPSISWWFGDEAALYSYKTWTVMLGRTRQFGKGGYKWLATSPRGRNWVWREFVQAGRSDYQLITAPTWANPHLEDEYVLSLLEGYDEDTRRQEVEGEFLANQGVIYTEFMREVHVTKTRPNHEFDYVVAGVDFGYNNPSVIEVVGQNSDGYKRVLYEDYARRRTDDELARAAAQLRDEFQIDTFFCDPSDPVAISKLVEAGCHAVQADNEVLAGISEVKRNLRRLHGKPALTFSPECANTIAEMEQYEWLVDKGGGTRDKPRKSFDHAMDALRYALMGLAANGGGSSTMNVDTYRAM